MRITEIRESQSTAMISYRIDGIDNEFKNIYTDYPIGSTDALRYIQAAAHEYILDTEDNEEIYHANLSILRSDYPSILVPGWSYWFTVIDLDEEDEADEEDEVEEEDEADEEDEEDEEGEE